LLLFKEKKMTRTTTTLFDFPSLSRTAVGFDRLFTDIERGLASSQSSNYPPYNLVEINSDEWMISIAVAGFGVDNLSITLDKNTLAVTGAQLETEGPNYLYRGISGRNFKRTFSLAEHIEVVNASLSLGMLNIHLKRLVPDTLQPKLIQITSDD
jgi:molecular chaperone IbpA